MANDTLTLAKNAKQNEFYTTYEVIEKEMNEYYEFNHDVFKDKTILLPCDDPEWSNFTKYFSANFKRLGLKKLISTSYAYNSKGLKTMWQPSLFEMDAPQYDENKSKSRGKIFILTRRNKNIDPDELKWRYLEGDGDFRSVEVTKLRNEADIIITNPPFSLYREFFNWIMEGKKKFAIIGNQTVYTYKEIFPYIKSNQVWVGTYSGEMAFRVPIDYEPKPTRYWQDETGQKWRSMGNATWLTNLDHGKRHEPLGLMTMSDNLKYNKKFINKTKKEFGELKYPEYDNFDAIEVCLVSAIPLDYDGYLGVPVTFLDKYCPAQFEIVGSFNASSIQEKEKNDYVLSKDTVIIDKGIKKMWNGPVVNKKPLFKRIVIKRKL